MGSSRLPLPNGILIVGDLLPLRLGRKLTSGLSALFHLRRFKARHPIQLDFVLTGDRARLTRFDA
jgi:hypothetical protein